MQAFGNGDDVVSRKTMPGLLPVSPIFGGHQTFAMRSGWLKKGLDALQDDALDGFRFFAREDAFVHLGVGKNMAQSIRYWLLATRMAEEVEGTRGKQLRPSSLGVAIFGSPSAEGWDPFMEDEGTLWLLHWMLAGGGTPFFSWAWTFNYFREYEFSREHFVDSLQTAALARTSKAPARETIARDVDCLLHTYAGSSDAAGEDSLDCPFSGLGLLRPSASRHYRFQVGPKPTLPEAIFHHAAISYWIRHFPAATALTVHDLTYSEGSPGMVFKLDEDTVLSYLDSIAAATDGAVLFSDTAMARQIVREQDITALPDLLLRKHYNA